MRATELRRMARAVPNLEMDTRILVDTLVMLQREHGMSFVDMLAEIGDEDLGDGESMPVDAAMVHACAVAAVAIQDLADREIPLPEL